ncbi:hypothetical protein B5807_09325 [Epicoccum nigrum]|uniref:Uncharacterized protein n=1 Tax=Epicoccum nigrum TaxID=105696 RepID=A0A1Y2LN32_EPING|nr:hypothetical protein B5807_09325 [Epicoccum nigrum]
MLESPSLCPLFPSTLRSCHLDGDDASCRPERRQGEDARRRPHGAITMPLNSSRLLSSDHTITQMRNVPCPNNTPQPVSLESLAALSRTARAVLRTPTPDPRDIPAPLHIFQRRSTEPAASSRVGDTRRHGMIIQDAIPPQQPANTSLDVPTSFPTLFLPDHDLLPSYTPLPNLGNRRMIDPSASPIVPAGVLSTCEVLISRQRELSSLRCQWTTHCRRCRKELHNPNASTEHTRFRSPVARSYDLPPPYAPVDPYPLYSDTTDYGELRRQRAKRSVFWARMALYPFIPETVLLDKAAYATAMGVEKVAYKMKKGVVSAGVRVMAVPGRIERGRAKRKIKWLEGRGLVEVAREGGETEGAERVERVRVVANATTATVTTAAADATTPTATATAAATGVQERPRNRNTNRDGNRNRQRGEVRDVAPGVVQERRREERRREERRRTERPREERPREQRSRTETPRQERHGEERSGEETHACTAYWHLGAVV